MKIHDYITNGGKNLIKEYLSNLPEDERREGYRIRHNIYQNGIQALNNLNTRQIKNKKINCGKLNFLKIE